MIRIASEAIARWLELEGAVSSSDHTLFSYAAYSCLFGLLPIGIVITLGICFGMAREAITLVIPFMLLRKFSGGFHLKSSSICFIVTITVLALTLWLVKYIACTGQTTVLSFSVIVSVVSLCTVSPIENRARKLSDKERMIFGSIVRVLAIASLIIYVSLLYCASIRYTSAFGVGILLVALLQIPSVLEKLLDQSDQTENT